MNRLLLVDGSNLLFQMFFGMPARIVNKDGRPIQGTLGFVGALLKLIRKTEPTHIAVLFDGEHENDRTALNPDYKANRPDYSEIPEDESPFSQLADVYRALDFLKIRTAETTECEVDDWISGYTKKYGGDANIIIASFDSDYFQLIDDNVTVIRYRGDASIICDISYINERLGISPSQYADFKSLVGDTSDNIRGADKIGPRTAAALLSEFGSLENIISNAEKIKKPSVRESVIRNTDRLRLNYKLISLSGTYKLPFELRELSYSYDGITTSDVLSKIGLK